ncbi:MATE family efflux transporter, partial [Vibrio parahaemolyticus]|nr:MATE family efflux transporter [Vibrio parahaemolyticus]
VHLCLSPVLILGLGPVPQLGVVGAGIAVVASYVAGVAVLLAYLLSGRGLVRLAAGGFRPQRRLLGDILQVGAPAGLGIVQWQVA